MIVDTAHGESIRNTFMAIQFSNKSQTVRSYDTVNGYYGTFSGIDAFEYEGARYSGYPVRESKTLLKLKDKAQLSFGLKAKVSRPKATCTTQFIVNGKSVFEKNTATDEELNIETVKTFPKGEFLIQTQLECIPTGQGVPLEEYAEFMKNPENRVMSGFDGEDSLDERQVIFEYQPFITNVDGSEILKMDTSPMVHNLNMENDASTIGNVTYSSDKGNYIVQNATYSYDYATPFNIVDFSEFEREKFINENAHTEIKFEFVPTEAGEYSVLLQTVSNLCYDSIQMLRNVVKGQCKTYHPLTELVVSDGDAACISNHYHTVQAGRTKTHTFMLMDESKLANLLA